MTRFDLQGVQDVRRILDSIYTNELNWIKRQVQIAAINVQREARRDCPADTGRLRSSIQFKFFNGGTVTRIYSDAYYAPYVEWGTGKYAHFGNGRQTPWKYYYTRIGRYVVTEGMKPRLMMTKAWKKELPELSNRIRQFRGI